MTSAELRDKFLNFFKEKGHTIVPSSSLIPSDPSVLFTTAGMQQFKPYYLGEKSPYGQNVASCQKCFRTSDIDQAGDERHLTFFEMLGNFSFGGYQKAEAIKLAKDFLDSINIKIDYVTVFVGDNNVPRDEESAKIWQGLGFSEEKGNLKFYDKKENFWGPTGEEGPCGPTTEIYSQGFEIWNIVFNQYYCNKDKSLKELPVFGVDTGMGLERLAKVSQNVPTIFETDLFSPLIGELPAGSEKEIRIIADHVKAAVFLISEGILPSNVEKGYILRRILRRAIRYGKLLGFAEQFLIPLAQKVVEIYKDVYPELKLKETDIMTVIQGEEEKFEKTLEQGLKEFEKNTDPFILFTTYGFPIELTQELAKEKGREIDIKKFNDDFKKHQELSRTASSGMFKGGLADTGEIATRYHTATHLLLAALRKVLGDHIFQRGSNINAERLRFDFSHSEKMTDEEIKKVENLVNEKIKENLEVVCEEMPLKIAKEKGATGVFENKYGDKVKVYTIGSSSTSSEPPFSREICGGPHVKKTSELGSFKIIKEEASSSGVRRIRAVLIQK